MGINARRIVKVEYDGEIFFKLGTVLSESILNHPDTNDFRNNDGIGDIEFPFYVLLEIRDNTLRSEMTQEEWDSLNKEIRKIEISGIDEADYITYACY